MALSRATVCQKQWHASHHTRSFTCLCPPLSASNVRACLYASGTVTKRTRPNRTLMPCCAACVCSYGLQLWLRYFVRDLQHPNYLTALTFRSTFRAVNGSHWGEDCAMPETKHSGFRGGYSGMGMLTASGGSMAPVSQVAKMSMRRAEAHRGMHGSADLCEPLRTKATVWQMVRCVHRDSTRM